MKFDLSECSIVIPFAIDCKERLEHLHFLLSYFDRYFLNHELIVVEQGDESIVPKHPNVRVKLIKKDSIFSSGSVSNRGVEFVKRPFFCRFDVDAFVHPKAIFDALEEFKRNPDLSMILPYNGVSFTIQNPLREEIMQSCNFEKLPFVKKEDLSRWEEKSMYVKNGEATGLIYFFRTSVFKKFGGFNEELMGWGFEDEELVARFRRLKNPPKYLENYNAFHLDHPRIPGDPIQAFKNQYRAHAVDTMDEEDLQEYIRSWNRFS
ncbi:MAG: glycosyltransferase family 2 protein [Parachlamydiales bacterium]|nr:glycosyltransferase family 2 protein [Parachlamydiales bacterium]